jgi:mannose-1-phosphate guanylyltransferase
MPVRAMVLAAGFGSRLGDIGRVRPKPMLPVLGVPLVRWAVRYLRYHGIREIVVNLHHLGEQIEAELGDGSRDDVAIAYSREEGQILGTGGGLRHARHLIDDGKNSPIVVMNAKLLVDLDLNAVLAAHRDAGAEATMVVRPDADAAKWGSQQLAADGRIVRLLGREPPVATPPPVSPPMMFTGIHVITPRLIDRVPPEGEQCVIRTAYRELFDEGQGLHGFVTERYWWEHSTAERYLQGVVNALEGRIALPYAPHAIRGVARGAIVEPGANVEGPVWIGAGARIEAGATVGPLAQIGPGSVVRAGATVVRSVIEAAEIRESVADRVIMHG